MKVCDLKANIRADGVVLTAYITLDIPFHY